MKQLTLGALSDKLITMLQTFPRETRIDIEGCDCIEAADGVRDITGACTKGKPVILITREDGVETRYMKEEDRKHEAA